MTMDGAPVYENPEVKAKIAYVPDELFFLPGANIKRMREEIKTVKFNDWYSYIKSGFLAEPSQNALTHISILAPDGTDSTDTEIDLFNSLLPKTCAQYLQEVLPLQERALARTEDFTESADLSYADTIDITCWGVDSQMGNSSFGLTSTSKEALLRLMEQGKGALPEAGQPFFAVRFADDGTNSYWGISSYAYFPLQDAQSIETMKTLLSGSTVTK